MVIRETALADLAGIRALHEQAFGDPEGTLVARLALALLDDETARPVLSLVSEQEGALCGHVIFSTITLDGLLTPAVRIMAPLAVVASSQRTGVGRSLIERGCELLAAQGVDCVLVLGEPDYYQRCGFTPAHDLRPPYELAKPEAWMARPLTPGALQRWKGVVNAADSLNAPQHW